MSKKFLILISGLLAAVVLAACGGGETIVEVTREVDVEREVEVIQEVVVTEVVMVEGEEVVVTAISEVVVTATPEPIPFGGAIVESSFADISTLNPIISSDNASSTVIGRMFHGLITLEEFSGAIVGDLAESWTVSEDGLVYTFTLKDNVTWTDGTPVTAHDVAFTMDAINTDEVASPRRSAYDLVESWEATGDFELVLTLSDVDCTVLAGIGTGVLPAHVFEGDPLNIVDSDFNLNPTVTNGPFKFNSWTPDEVTILDANEDYFEGRPFVDQWLYQVYADQSAEFAALLAGEITYTNAPPQFVSRIDAEIASGAPFVTTKYFANSYNFVGYNLANPANPQNGWDDLDGDGVYTDGEPPLPQDPHPVLSDNEVRRAIAYSIDYTGIINKVAFGQGGPIVANVKPAIAWAYNTDLVPYEQDLELAAQILDDAGWVDSDGDGIRDKDGQPLAFELLTNAGNEVRENIGVLLKDVLDGIGFDITFTATEFGTVVQRLLGQEYDAVIIGFGGGAPEPDDSSQFSYKNDEVGAGFNFVSYYNETVENNLSDGKSVPGCAEADRAPFYLSNQEEIQADLPYSFLYVGLVTIAVQDHWVGIEPNAWNTRHNIIEWYPDN